MQDVFRSASSVPERMVCGRHPMRRATRRRIGRYVLAIGAALLWSAGPLPALVPEASADEITYSCGIRDAAGQNNVFSYVSVYGINPYSGLRRDGPRSRRCEPEHSACRPYRWLANDCSKPTDHRWG